MPTWRQIAGWTAIGVVGGGSLALSVLAAPFVSPALRRICIPYVPATATQLGNVQRAIKLHVPHPAPLVDLGSGDGRIVLDCAARGIPSSGVELNAWLVIYAKVAARRKGLQDLAKFHRRDILKTRLEDYNTAVLFGSEGIMELLEPKLGELKQDAHLLACRFPLPAETQHFEQIATVGEGIDAVWVYRRK